MRTMGGMKARTSVRAMVALSRALASLHARS